MVRFEIQNSVRILVALEKFLILDDDFQELSLQKKIFSQRMRDDIIKKILYLLTIV